MRAIPGKLEVAFREELGRRRVAARGHWEWVKWLRFYLDFCGKYGHAERDSESLGPFLGKLGSKGQSAGQQARAARSVEVFYEVVKGFPLPGERAVMREDDPRGWPWALEEMRKVTRVRQNSPKTWKAYAAWVRGFRGFVAPKGPQEVEGDDAARYLTYLATERNVTATTQNQAFHALLFLFRHVLEKPFELGKTVVRARRRRHVPVVLSRGEIDRLVAQLPDPYRLLALVLYGSGLRLAEGLNLRIHCFNFEDMILTVHDGKGGKDRAVPLPHALKNDLLAHRERVRAQFDEDCRNEKFRGAFMPRGSETKWNARCSEWIWQFFFPARNLTFVPDENACRRYHLHEAEFGKRLRRAARAATLDKRVTAHTFRHSFASHLLLANYDIRTIQEMLGHSDIRTTMIYTQTVPSRTLKDRRSPLDF